MRLSDRPVGICLPVPNLYQIVLGVRPEASYTEKIETPGSFVIEMTHRKSKAKYFLGALPTGPREFVTTKFDSLEDASRHPFPSTEVCFGVLAQDAFRKTKDISYKIVEAVTR
jgi:hypothetical protein